MVQYIAMDQVTQEGFGRYPSYEEAVRMAEAAGAQEPCAVEVRSGEEARAEWERVQRAQKEWDKTRKQVLRRVFVSLATKLGLELVESQARFGDDWLVWLKPDAFCPVEIMKKVWTSAGGGTGWMDVYDGEPAGGGQITWKTVKADDQGVPEPLRRLCAGIKAAEKTLPERPALSWIYDPQEVEREREEAKPETPKGPSWREIAAGFWLAADYCRQKRQYRDMRAFASRAEEAERWADPMVAATVGAPFPGRELQKFAVEWTDKVTAAKEAVVQEMEEFARRRQEKKRARHSERTRAWEAKVRRWQQKRAPVGEVIDCEQTFAERKRSSRLARIVNTLPQVNVRVTDERFAGRYDVVRFRARVVKHLPVEQVRSLHDPVAEVEIIEVK